MELAYDGEITTSVWVEYQLAHLLVQYPTFVLVVPKRTELVSIKLCLKGESLPVIQDQNTDERDKL